MADHTAYLFFNKIKTGAVYNNGDLRFTTYMIGTWIYLVATMVIENSVKIPNYRLSLFHYICVRTKLRCN